MSGDVRWGIVQDPDLGVIASVTVDGQIVSTAADRGEFPEPVDVRPHLEALHDAVAELAQGTVLPGDLLPLRCVNCGREIEVDDDGIGAPGWGHVAAALPDDDPHAIEFWSNPCPLPERRS